MAGVVTGDASPPTPRVGGGELRELARGRSILLSRLCVGLLALCTTNRHYQSIPSTCSTAAANQTFLLSSLPSSGTSSTTPSSLMTSLVFARAAMRRSRGLQPRAQTQTGSVHFTALPLRNQFPRGERGPLRLIIYTVQNVEIPFDFKFSSCLLQNAARAVSSALDRIDSRIRTTQMCQCDEMDVFSRTVWL
jgi:hypothetical protein